MGYWCNKCRDTIMYNVYEYSMDHFGKPLCYDCQKQLKSSSYTKKTKSKKATPEAKKLYEALRKRGIKCELEYNDGYKSVDICIEWAGLDIEVDGNHHLFNPNQLFADIERQYYSSEDGFETIHIPNSAIKRDVNGIADSIAAVARKRYYET